MECVEAAVEWGIPVGIICHYPVLASFMYFCHNHRIYIHTYTDKQKRMRNTTSLHNTHIHTNTQKKQGLVWADSNVQQNTCSKEARKRHSVCKKQDRTKRCRCKVTSR